MTLDVQVKDISYERPIRPRLEFKLGIRGDRNKDLKFGRIDISVGGESSDPRPLTSQATVFDIELHQQRERYDTLVIELTDSDLDRIEEIRGGSDLTVKLDGEFHLSHRGNDKFETQQFSVSHRIPKSDWADILSEFGYGDIQVIELYFPDSPAREHFEKSWNHIEDADEQFARGNWGETLTHCRKAIEVIDNLEKAEDVDEFIGEVKWDHMGSLKGNLKRFLSLGPHSEEGIGHEKINRRDAQSSLLISKALVNFVADALRERDN